jgi:outer membrane protein insertion porin family
MINLNRFLSLICFLIVSTSIMAQESDVLTIGQEMNFDYSKPKKYEIGAVRIEGADNYDHNAVRLIAGLRPGQMITIPGNDISKAISNLWKEQLFSNVEIFAEKEIAGVIYLVIKITPRPKLSRYKFKGATKKEVDKIREEIDLFSGKTITENLVYTTKGKIVDFYKEKGYYSVEVNIKRVVDTLINNSEIFYIDVIKNQKVKIQNNGNERY